MSSTNMEFRSKNEAFYNKAYGSKLIFKAVAKVLVSYDQLSKSRRNHAMLSKCVIFEERINILDYGFGNGTFLLRLPRKHQLHGCELSSEAIRNMYKICHYLHRDIQLYTPEQLSNSGVDVKMDLICCSHVIEHVDDQRLLMKLFYDELIDGGRLLLNVPINEVWTDPKHARSYSVETTCQLMKSAGFKIQSVQEVDRWTAFILYHEHIAKIKFRFLFRFLRLILALFPVTLLDSSEKILPSKYKNQQLLVLGEKV